MIAFIKYTLMSTAALAVALALVALQQYDVDQDALRNVVSARSL